MTISPISCSNYQNTINIRKNNNLPNNSQVPENQVAFKGVTSKATSETVKKSSGKILAALAGLLGFAGIASKKNNNIKNAQVNKSIETTPQSIIDSLDVSPEAKIFGKNLEKLTIKEYIQVGYDDYITRDIDVYNKTAIIKATELYDTDPKTAFELASLFKESGKANDADVEFVINKHLAEPELVMEYKNKLVTHARNSLAYGDKYQRSNWEPDFDDMLHLTKAIDKNKEIVDMLIKRLDNKDVFSCRRICALTNFDKSVVSKYLNDTRIPFDYEDVIKLCELDSKYSKEIDELMDIANSMMTEEDKRRYPHYKRYKISNIVEKYAESPEECKKIFKLTGINLDALGGFKVAYEEVPEFITRLYNFYKKEYCTEYVQSDAFRDIYYNYKKYETILNLLDKQGWQNMSDEDFAKNMKSIRQAEIKINAVIKEAGNDMSKCGTRVANIVKAQQLPFENLYKA
ncbi:hypothetical protein IJ384_04795 [bacterium]|nr:hypothetical protein [bacterium]